MATTKLSHRIFFFFLAFLFFMTAVSFSGLVVWQQHQQNHADKVAKEIQDNLKTCTTAKPKLSTYKKGTTLQGTQLQNFTPCKVDKLEAIDVTEGTGDPITASDTVTVDYTGAVAETGTIFQSSLDTGGPATFPLNQVIAGWTEGMPGMKVGGVRRLLIPAAQAYGSNPPSGSGIPVDADLVSDITLHKVGAQ